MATAANIGDVIDNRYTLTRRIGRGAMAEVFAAHDRRQNRDVAIKFLRTSIAGDAEAVARFRHEAKVQRMIEHRNVARLYDAGIDRETLYLSMELLRGKSLFTVLRKLKRVPVHFAVCFAYQALAGLSATHAAGVLHRDLKPANLMLEPGPGPVERVALIDFGFASLGAATGLTERNMVVGSPSYLAPERLRNEPSDGRADIYGMGIILYEMLCGQPPFTGTDTNIITGHVQRLPTAPRIMTPDASICAELENVVLRALDKDPKQRWSSATAMGSALESAVHGEHLVAPT